MLPSRLRVIAAALVHALSVVVSAVHAEPFFPSRWMIGQPVRGTGDQWRVVLAAHLHRQQTSGRHGKRGAPLAGRVAKATGLIVPRQSVAVQRR